MAICGWIETKIDLSLLAQIYFTKELAERYKNIFTSFSLHPGAVNTEITRYHNTGLGSIFTNMVRKIGIKKGSTEKAVVRY